MTLSKTEMLIPTARTLLKNKKFCKARWLARNLNISHTLAGRILLAMDEWTKHTFTTSRGTWIKGKM